MALFPEKKRLCSDCYAFPLNIHGARKYMASARYFKDTVKLAVTLNSKDPECMMKIPCRELYAGIWEQCLPGAWTRNFIG